MKEVVNSTEREVVYHETVDTIRGSRIDKCI